MKKKHDAGFSLVELVVVIAIMFALVAVVAASVLRYRLKANEAVNKANIKAAKDNASYEAIENGQADYYVLNTGNGKLAKDDTRGYEIYRDEHVNLSDSVYPAIYVKCSGNEILTWPYDNMKNTSVSTSSLVANNDDSSNNDSSDETNLHVAVANDDGTYNVRNGDYIIINGEKFQYIGKDSDNAKGPKDRRGKKYWKKI